MERLINFSGIGFEIGQKKIGLGLTTQFARKYFYQLKNFGIQVIDQGDVISQKLTTPVEIYSKKDILKIQLENYKNAYLKSLNLLNKGLPLINWGGDHSIAISTVSAFLNYYQDGYVIWIDAHADLNLPEKSLTGNFHGMPLSILLNLNNIGKDYFPWIEHFLCPSKLIYIGLRDVDDFEYQTIQELGITTFFKNDIDNIGIQNVIEQVQVKTKNFPLHISFDIDSIDPSFAPSTGVHALNGITPDDLYLFGNSLNKNQSTICSIDIVEINPTLGTESDRDNTYTLANNFLNSIFNNHLKGVKNVSMGKRNQRNYGFKVERNLQIST